MTLGREFDLSLAFLTLQALTTSVTNCLAFRSFLFSKMPFELGSNHFTGGNVPDALLRL